MRISCAIYTNKGIILLNSIDDEKVLIPEKLASFPRIVTNMYGSRILLNEGSDDPHTLEAIKEHIRTLVAHYESNGPVRIDTPSFYEMLIYNCDESLADYSYPNLEEAINSFLCSRGAEFVV